MELENFRLEKNKNIEKLTNSKKLWKAGFDFLRETSEYKYTYNFTWMGVPIIQVPQDMIAMQEIIWEIKPDLIIETGIAHGGSLVYYASLLELIGHGTVLGVDIDIREHNRKNIENHPMAKRIKMIQGSAIDDKVVEEVKKVAQGAKKILVALDSNHTHEHVALELEKYSPLVAVGSYLVVFDTAIEDMPEGFYPSKPWNKQKNPKTAVHEFLNKNSNFVLDKNVEGKLLITVCPDGFLKRIK